MSDLSLANIEKLDVIDGKATALDEHAKKFQTQATATKRKFCYESYRNLFCIFIIIVVREFITLLDHCSKRALEILQALALIIWGIAEAAKK